MDAEVQAYIDKWADKSIAKERALAAMGEAMAAGEAWESDGSEAALFAEAQQLADDYVASHPDMFTSFEYMVSPENHDLLVQMISLLTENGRIEEATKLTMFELARFERQHVGQRIRAVVRR